MENHVRSIMKTITWRIVGTVPTVLLVFLFTGNLPVSFGVGSLEFVSKIPLYYLHERLWNLLPYGRINPSDKQKKRDLSQDAA